MKQAYKLFAATGNERRCHRLMCAMHQTFALLVSSDPTTVEPATMVKLDSKEKRGVDFKNVYQDSPILVLAAQHRATDVTLAPVVKTATDRKT
jgi:hypothetical protein